MLNFETQREDFSLANAACLARCAKIAYAAAPAAEGELRALGMADVRFIDREGTQAFVAASGEVVVLAFRGTEPTRIEDVLTDAMFALTDGEFGSGDRVHLGFKRALDDVWGDVILTIGALQTAGQTLWITGHSLGAALATLAAVRLWRGTRRVAGVYTFGSPRAGNGGFAAAYDAILRSRTFRFVNQSDIVTRVPLWTLNYRHVGTVAYFDEAERLRIDPPGWWTQVMDSLISAIGDLRSLGVEAFKDHSMDLYLRRVEAARARG